MTADANPGAPQKRCILIVEDEEDIRDLMAELLEASLPDVEVVTAPNGAEGLRILGERPIHLVITDFKMPGMNGLEFLAGARARAPNTPRILMTAFPDLEIAVKAINEAHIENFFAKPVEPTEVVEKVRRVLELHEQRYARERAFARSVNVLAKRVSERDP